MAEILREPFDNLTAWTAAGGGISVGVGRTGTGALITLGATSLRYTIPAPSETDTLTLGFAFLVGALPSGAGATANLLTLRSDAAATLHDRLTVSDTGALQMFRNITSLGTSAAGVIVAGVWAYVEVQVKLADVGGFVIVRVNGTTVINLASVDTKNAGTKTTFDTVSLERTTTAGLGTYTFDDLYVKTGTSDTFNGDIHVGAPLATTSVHFTAAAAAGVIAVGAGTTSIHFAPTATGRVIAVGSGATSIHFTGAATGVAFSGYRADATLRFTAVATGHKVGFGAGTARLSFRAFAQMVARVRHVGAWHTPIGGTAPVALVSGEFVPAAGSLVLVLYALQVEGVRQGLSGGGAGGDWWASNGGVAGAVSDSFTDAGPWRSWMANEWSASGTPESWLVGVAYRAIGADPGPGAVTVGVQPHPGLPQFAWMDVVEVRGWKARFGPGAGIMAGFGADAPHAPNDGTDSVDAVGIGTTYLDDDQLTFGVELTDAIDATRSGSDPKLWRGLANYTTAMAPTAGFSARTAFLRTRTGETELTAPFRWTALPDEGVRHLALGVSVLEGDTPGPTPRPFAEFLVEFQDEHGEWVDITCDTRTADIDAGRTDIIGAFDAATLTLTMANFEGVYSPWPPDSIWAQAGRYRTDVPIRVNLTTQELSGGVIANVFHPLFTGSTDAINDSWPGTIDAMVTVTASDGFKALARVDTSATIGADGKPVEVGFGESTGQRIVRWLNAAGYRGATAIDGGVARMAGTTMDGNALGAVQDVAFAEGLGVVYVRADGTLVFRQRDAIVTDPHQTTIQATFTDRDDDPAGACYSDVVPIVDETPVYNVARMGSAGDPTGQLAVDADSVDWFGPRTYPPKTDLGLHEWNDDLAVAILIVYTHAHDEKRVERIVINPGFDPTVWDVGATLTLLDRVRVVRHFPGGYIMDEPLLVQGVHHRLVGTGQRVPGHWEVTYDTVRAIPVDSGVTFCKWDRGHWDVCAWGL